MNQMINNHGIVRTTPSIPDSNIAFNAPLCHNWVYINGTGYILFLSWRDGVTHTLPPANVDPKWHGKLVVRKTVEYSKNATAMIPGYNSSDPELTVIHNQYRSSLSQNLRGLNSGFIDYMLEWEEIERHNGAVYLTDLDIVVSVNAPTGKSPHPFNSHSETIRRVKERHGDDIAKTSIEITIVDNTGNMGDRFLNIDGVIQRIAPIRDECLTSGVYVRRTRLINEDGQDVIPKTVSSSLFEHDYDVNKKATSPILYRSFEEAKYEGDRSGRLKRELDDLEIERKRERLALEELETLRKMDKLALDNEKLRYETLIEESKAKFQQELLQSQMAAAENDKRLKQELIEIQRDVATYDREIKRKALNDKDHYESRSYRRKDDQEILKSAPLILTGLIGVAALIGKLYK